MYFLIAIFHIFDSWYNWPLFSIRKALSFGIACGLSCIYLSSFDVTALWHCYQLVWWSASCQEIWSESSLSLLFCFFSHEIDCMFLNAYMYLVFLFLYWFLHVESLKIGSFSCFPGFRVLLREWYCHCHPWTSKVCFLHMLFKDLL